MRPLRPSTWAARCVVAATVLLVPVAFVASCDSFESTSSSSNDAGAETSVTDEAGPSRLDASTPDGDGGVGCHTGDLLLNLGFEAAGCTATLAGIGVTQSRVPGHDSATACAVCGGTGQLQANAPGLRLPPLKPGRYVSEAWVRRATPAVDAGDAGTFARISLYEAIYPAGGGGYAIPGGGTALSDGWTCLSASFDVPSDAGVVGTALYVEGDVRGARDCFEVDDFGVYPALDGGFEPCTCH